MSMRNIRILEDTFDKKVFNDVALHPLQAWGWGEARKRMGIAVIRIGIFDKDALIETYQMTIHSVSLGYKIGYLPPINISIQRHPKLSIIVWTKKQSHLY